MIRKIVLSWMLIGSFLLAQKITQIKFEGLNHLSPQVAMEIAGLHVGDEMNIDKINQALVNFYNQGYFEDVWVDREGGKLIFHFKEKVAIANVEIKGFGSGDEASQLLNSIGLKKGDLYDEARVEQAKKLLTERLQSMGNYDSVIEVTTTPVGDNAVSVVFDVNKGEKIKIKKINFDGAKALDKSDLERDLVNKEEDFLGWIPFLNDGEVHVDQLEYDAYRLKDTYMQHGYLDAEVSKPLMRVDYSNYTAEVDYQIKEGPQYRVGEVSISQDVPGLNTQELLSELKLKQGKIFNIKRMRKDMEMIKNTVGDLGYAYAKVSPQMRKDEAKKIVNLQYVVHPGKKVHIHDVLISGNDTTKDRVIRRYIYLAPGDLFSATDLKDSKSALGRTGFFEQVDIQSQRVSDDEIDLLVKVKEASTGTISLGGGYGSYEGLMVNASISDKNLFGTGITGSLGFDISKISQSYNLSFVNPKVWDSMYSLGLSLYKREYEYYDYTEDTLGGSLNLGRQFFRHIYASVGVGYIDNNSEYNENYLPSDDPLYNIYNDQYQKLSGFASISWDNTDDYYQPREGYIASLNVEFASMDGDDYNPVTYPDGYSNFTKFNAKFGAYYGLEDWIDYDLILRFKARGTYISKDDNAKLPVAERLFMGGIGSVRGYQPYSIAPELPNGDRIGGTYRTSATVEASIPLSEAAKMRLAFFYDIGMIGMDSERYIPIGVTNPTESDVDRYPGQDITRSSIGAVVEWNSGFGPINLVFGYALDDEPGDETSVFEFSMGSKF
jgi:outer membrane protein insertion porin family